MPLSRRDRRKCRVPSNYASTPEDVVWCCQFIVTASLRLSAAEAQLHDPYQGTQTWKRIATRPSPGAELVGTKSEYAAAPRRHRPHAERGDARRHIQGRGPPAMIARECIGNDQP